MNDERNLQVSFGLVCGSDHRCADVTVYAPVGFDVRPAPYEPLTRGKDDHVGGGE